MNSKGQADLGVGGLIALLILVSVGAFVVYEITGSLTSSVDRTDAVTTTANSTFATDPTTNWDNISEDNAKDFWGVDAGATGADNHWVGDNCGGGASTQIYYQTFTMPQFDGITTATITGAYSTSDNTDLIDVNIYVILENPAGDNTIVLQVENTTALITADNDTWTAIENSVATLITAPGAYVLYIQDNSTKTDVVAVDNYVSIRWDNVMLSVTGASAGYAENAIADVEDRGSTTFSLVTILAIVLVAALIIGVVMRAIGGAVGGEQGAGTVAPAF